MILRTEEVVKKYKSRCVVNKVSVNVKQGEIVGLLGPNGAGKTTTMKILTGFIPPSSGTVKIAGYDVTEHPVQVKKKIGYLPENPPLYKDMIVY